MTVEQSEIDQMVRTLAILNGQQIETKATPVSKTLRQPVQNGDPEVNAMRSILEAYYGSEKNVETGMNKVTKALVTDAKSDRPLRESLTTVSTSSGVSIGEWEIRMRKDSGRKFYDVVSNDGETLIASDITLYEAAYGIARSLSENIPITSQIVRDILRLEEEYAGALSDAIHFKHSLSSRRLIESRKAIMEDRYDAAKQRALKARSQIENLVGPLPF